jgi:hypothetical protein
VDAPRASRRWVAGAYLLAPRRPTPRLGGWFLTGLSAADQLAVLLSLWSYDRLIARYPNAIIELTGFPYGS